MTGDQSTDSDRDGRADSLARWLAAAPSADADTATLAGWLRDGCALGLHPLFIQPGGKEPVDLRTAAERREDDGAAQDAARAAGRRNWDKVKAPAGVHLATNDPDRLAEYQMRYRERFGEGCAVNIGVALGPSRVAVVDCDQAEEVSTLRNLLGLPEDAAPTVRTPGAQRDGEWIHRDGGHFWAVVPEDIDVPTSRKLGRAGDLKGSGSYVLIPPSVRPEGAYAAAGSALRYGGALRVVVEASAPEPRSERSEAPDEGLALSVDSWAVSVPWGDLLERHGWSDTGRPDACGCPIWTAPGDHASPKSATAHDAVCSIWDSDSDPENRPLRIWTDNPGPELEAWTASTGKTTLSKLQFVAIMEHGGNQGATIFALGIDPDRANTLGFGTAPAGAFRSSPTVLSAVPGTRVLGTVSELVPGVLELAYTCRSQFLEPFDQGERGNSSGGSEPVLAVLRTGQRYKTELPELFADQAAVEAAGDPDSEFFADVDALLCDGLPEPPSPDFMLRDDDMPIFYAGKVNTIIGDPECGKTWLALAAVAERLTTDPHSRALVVDVDHNGLQAIVSHLLALGVPAATLRDRDNRFRYVAPADSSEVVKVVEIAGRWRPTIAVLDSVGELVPMCGLKSVVDDDYTKVHQIVFAPIAAAGAAVLTIDHLVKNPDSRKYGAGGAVAKKRAVDGLAVRVTVARRFVSGKGGAATLRVNKDRHGGVRRIAHDDGKNEALIGMFVLHPLTAMDVNGQTSESLTYWIESPLRDPLDSPAAEPDSTGTDAEGEEITRLVAKIAALDPPPKSINDAQARIKGASRAKFADAMKRWRASRDSGEQAEVSPDALNQVTQRTDSIGAAK